MYEHRSKRGARSVAYSLASYGELAQGPHPRGREDVWAWRRALSLRSAGLLLYRRRDGKLEVLLVHPGGPFWRKRDEGVWSIPKGEFAENEVGVEVARREFLEELGTAAPKGEPTALGEVRQAGGKVVQAWALLGDLDVTRMTSNMFEIEWPPRSGRMQQFPEVDRAGWFDVDAARRKLLPAQHPFIDRLEELL